MKGPARKPIAADARAKGRMNLPESVGEKNGNARLTEADVRAIRAAYATGCVSQMDLANQYDVEQAHIGRIVRYERWRETR